MVNADSWSVFALVSLGCAIEHGFRLNCRLVLVRSISVMLVTVAAFSLTRLATYAPSYIVMMGLPCTAATMVIRTTLLIVLGRRIGYAVVQ